MSLPWGCRAPYLDIPSEVKGHPRPVYSIVVVQNWFIQTPLSVFLLHLLFFFFFPPNLTSLYLEIHVNFFLSSGQRIFKWSFISSILDSNLSTLVNVILNLLLLSLLVPLLSAVAVLYTSSSFRINHLFSLMSNTLQ